jgi:hypothetical protein
VDEHSRLVLTDLRALSERYARGVDRRDAGLFLSAFHPDARLSVNRPSESPEPVQMVGDEQLSRVPVLITAYPKTYHLLGQSSYDIKSERATGEVYCMAHHLTPGRHGGTDYVMFIRYDDTYALSVEGEWRIAQRRVLVDWTETRAANPEGK